ncbi:MAG: hypothetical protein KIH89_000870 [Candidatus Shapirobacteria bacterium]|nr:hypothetical protein [Candidatus Shapirobacteria bacterium]
MTENNINPNLTNITTPESKDNPEIQPDKTQTSPKINYKIISIIFGVVILVSAIGASAYYLGAKKSPSPQPTQNTSSSDTAPTDKPIETTPLFSGRIQKLTQDLKLYKDDGDQMFKASYFSAGTFNKGDLQGYTRIIALKSIGPGEPSSFILATKDFQTYVLDDPESNVTKYAETEWQNPYNYLDKNKIVSAKTFETDQPKEIKLDSKFSLVFSSLLTEYHQTDQKDNLGNSISENLLTENFSSYKKIDSPINNLTFYFKPNQKNNYFDQMTQSQKDKELLKLKYFPTETEITTVDSTGLPQKYSLGLSGSDKKSVAFKSSAIQNKNNLKFYKDYSEAIPGGCSLASNTKVINLADNDLELIGTVSNIPLYHLKDSNHELYKLAYDNKMDYYNSEFGAVWNDINKGITKPTLSEYINNNPLLFFKDYWQRWVAVGEYDIQLPGGCGKPVIYLYPKKTTQVSVKFNVPVQFTTDIPKYNDSWQVLAKPDGSLQNLKSNQATCSQIDFAKKGSEYAKKACETNNYPYLYWAGNIYSQKYPEITKGWIVAKDDLNNFLQNKLSEIGLNSNEKKDFIDYWLPDMLFKNSSYYRLSFLQTNELNSLFPMTVEPKPDTVFRIFLDYLPLSQKPTQEISPQSLNKLVRNGFTLVEWGGLKQY